LVSPVTSIGVAVCGLFTKEGELTLCELPLLVGYNPKKALQSLFPQSKVVLLNDASAALLYVKKTYQLDGNEDQNIAVIIVGTGIGTAFLVHGKELKGAQGLAGGLGCSPILINVGEKEWKTATLDELSGGRTICNMITPTKPEELVQVLNHLRLVGHLSQSAPISDHHKKLLKVVQEAGRALGIGMAIILHSFNPSLIVLGGGVFNFEGYLEAALESARENTYVVKEVFQNCKIILSEQKNELVALGALIAGME